MGTPSGSQTVATFTDPGGDESLANYSASINWGDGNTSAGAITGPVNGVYTVDGVQYLRDRRVVSRSS